jgi:lactaldehyde dehydrogenase
MKMLINGEQVDSDTTIQVRNPFNNEIIDTVPSASVEQATRAIEAAVVYDYHLSAWDRYEILMRFCDLLKRDEQDFVELISAESGKTVADARAEIARAWQTMLLCAEEAKRINGEVLPVDAVQGLPAKLALVIREPIGPIVAITPFNYPLNLVAHKVGPALAANNPVIVKPSSHAPLTALKMAILLLEAGLPPAMLHVVTGDASIIGDALVTHPMVRKVTFTGSVEIGKAICAKVGMKKVSMELGGNDPLILLADTPIEEAIPCAVQGAFGNNGQRCTSIKRIIIDERIADIFIERFTEATRMLRVGNPMEESTDIGPLIDEQAAIRVSEKVQAAVNRGALLVHGGKREGSIYHPTILDRVNMDMEIVSNETFGPVAPFIRVHGFDEAIAVANATPYGLQSGIFTGNLDLALKAARRIHAGAVVINGAPGFRAEHLPFGGVKDSGIGREGVRYAIESMTELKTIIL